jgi:hypothetical protein
VDSQTLLSRLCEGGMQLWKILLWTQAQVWFKAVCDSQGKFLEMSILYPGSTSDCLAFEGICLFTRLEGGLLAPSLSLFGDNAYLNSMFMATPYAGVSGGSKDAYNFITHSFVSRLSVLLACSQVIGLFFAAQSQCKRPSRRRLRL